VYVPLHSYSHWWETDEQVGAILQGELLPDTVDYFAGRAGDDEESDGDEDDELDEDEDDDEGSIDLGDEEEAGPSKKKAKTG
jgi:hypothetical protein